MSDKILFFNITWMRSYTGLRNDSVAGGGDYIKQHGWGHEIFNFSPTKGKLYGYGAVQGNINIDKLGADSSDEFIKGVTVVWTAKKPTGGTLIVGWYKNATVYRSEQIQPRSFRENQIDYFAECNQKDATLLTEDERVFEVPRGKDGFGQRNIWYASNNRTFVSKVNDYIFKGLIPTVIRKRKGKPFQVDSIKRKKVENAAIKHIYDYYSKLGYDIKSVEEEKVGWDLEATKGKTKLLLEVKGLSGFEISVELTHNEYTQLKANKNNFRLCVVTSALTKPTGFVFSYSNTDKIWTDEKQKRKLNFNDLTAARVTA